MACGEGVSENIGLAEGHGETFTGDGVYGAGGVADERDGIGVDAFEPACGGDAATLRGNLGGVAEALDDLREVVEKALAVKVRAWRNEDGADLVGGDGRDVDLADFAPVDLNVLAPRLDAIVTACADALARLKGVVETGPGADARGGSVGADEMSVGRGNAVHEELAAGQKLGASVPRECGSGLDSTVCQALVEIGAADADAGADGERAFDGVGSVEEAKAGERMAFVG